MFKRLTAIIIVALTVFAADARSISDIRPQGSSWYIMYDENGRRYKTLTASSVGRIMGWSSTFFVSCKGSWIYLYDAEGRRYKTMAASSVGDVIAVSGNTFTSRKGSWIYTYDSTGRRINTRSAR